MEYKINNSKIINWNAKGNDRILQNVQNLINTIEHEVAYSREKGRNSKTIDKNFDDAQSLIIAETYELLEVYEDRVEVLEVNVSQGVGFLNIEVVVNIE